MFLPKIQPRLDRWSRFCFPLVVAALLVAYLWFRVHNVFSFNPYWGYDGGGHLDYVFSLVGGRFPSIQTNYIAWHEPFYYLVNAPLLRTIIAFTGDYAFQIRSLSLFQAGWSVLALVAIYRVTRVLLPRWVALSFTVLFSALPAFQAASLFVTNELFAFLFAFLISWLLFARIREERFRPFDGLWFGALMGFALISKITTIIPVSACVLTCLFLWRKGVAGLHVRFFVFTLLTIAAINLPWQIYRYNHIARGPTLNNPGFLQPHPLSLPELFQVTRYFDTRVFTIPYFPMGSGNLWPMLYSDFVSDYYGAIDNVDVKNATPKTELFQTADFSWVTLHHAYYMKRLILVGVSLVLLVFLGVFVLVWRSLFARLWQDRAMAGFGALVSFGYLAAQVFYLARYPYFDMGAVKAIFILPGFLFPMIYGTHFLYGVSRKHLLLACCVLLITIPFFAYSYLSYAGFFLPSL